MNCLKIPNLRVNIVAKDALAIIKKERFKNCRAPHTMQIVISAAITALLKHQKRLFLELPCGSGKSKAIAMLAVEAL